MNYTSGRIIAGRNSTNVAGFIGSIDSGGGNTITNSFWDTDSSLQRTGVAAGSNTGVTGGCFSGTCTNGGTVNFSDITTYNNAGWDITSTPTLTGSAPGNAWFIFDDSTRPLLTIEHETNISNAHQLQMMGAALGGSYTLANNIDLTNALTNTSDVWGTNYNTSTGSGFVPIGAGSVATAFQGTFNGQNFVINNLYINRPLTNFVGLFGANIGSGTTISNLGLTNVNVTGLSAVGGLLGQNSNSGAAGFVGGTLPAEVGNISSNITNVYVTGNVTGSGALIGGLIGYNSAGTLSNAYSTANVTATGGILALAGFTGTGVGGLTGSNGGNITTSYASGNVSATQASSLVGGLTGYHIFGSISQSYSNNLITAANGSSSESGGR